MTAFCCKVCPHAVTCADLIEARFADMADDLGDPDVRPTPKET